jgi:SAM-dependent methyltransferase
MSVDREKIRALAREYYSAGKPTGWFEALYASAAGDASIIPWADLRPNENLIDWLEREQPTPAGGRRAMVIGCGLGDDAEELARRGWKVTAFDISASAIEWCRRRFPKSPVEYAVADLLRTPAAWRGAFDFVFESYTLQAIPDLVRREAIPRLPAFLAPGGRLLIICRGRDETDPPGELPYPLLRSELSPLIEPGGLTLKSFEDYVEPGQDPPARRFRAVYQNPLA